MQTVRFLFEGRTDTEDLAGGDVHVGRQDVPPYQSVDEGAVGPFGLPDHQHLVGVLPQLPAGASQGRRGIRRLEPIGPRDRLAEDGNGVLADPLERPSYVGRIPQMMPG